LVWTGGKRRRWPGLFVCRVKAGVRYIVPREKIDLCSPKCPASGYPSPKLVKVDNKLIFILYLD